MSQASYRITERKCATCRWWDGARRVKFSGTSPCYVEAESGAFPCIAFRSKKTTAATTCSRYERWERL